MEGDKLPSIITSHRFPKQGSCPSDLLLIKNQIADTAVKGASRPEPQDAFSCWNATSIEVGNIHGAHFC